MLKQRGGRIHRIGSEHKVVNIINMITNDTIDETILKTIESKTELTEGLVEKTQGEKDIMKELLDNLK